MRTFRSLLTAALAAMFFLSVAGCGSDGGTTIATAMASADADGGTSSTSTSTNDSSTAQTDSTTAGWAIEISRWMPISFAPANGLSYNECDWIVVGTDVPLVVGDIIDLSLVQVDPNRGGMDVVRSVILPNGCVFNDADFGKGGLILPVEGWYTFTIHASTASGGEPTASCRRWVDRGKG